MSEIRLRQAEIDIATLQKQVNAFKRVMRATPGDLTVFPWRWQAWTPTFTGFTATVPTNVVARYFLIGKVCYAHVFMGTAGTSNANTFTVSAPFQGAAYTQYGTMPFGVDNGTGGAYLGIAVINSSATVFSLAKGTSYTGWTTSGSKRAYFFITYEVA